MKDIKKPFQHERIHKSIHSKPKREKNDKFILGLALGIITPVVGMFLVWVLMFSDIALKYILRWFVAFDNPRVLNEISKLVSLGMILNLAPFYWFLNKKRYETVKGIILASFFYLILVLMYKWVLQ